MRSAEQVWAPTSELVTAQGAGDRLQPITALGQPPPQVRTNSNSKTSYEFPNRQKHTPTPVSKGCAACNRFVHGSDPKPTESVLGHTVQAVPKSPHPSGRSVRGAVEVCQQVRHARILVNVAQSAVLELHHPTLHDLASGERDGPGAQRVPCRAALCLCALETMGPAACGAMGRWSTDESEEGQGARRITALRRQ